MHINYFCELRTEMVNTKICFTLSLNCSTCKVSELSSGCWRYWKVFRELMRGQRAALDQLRCHVMSLGTGDRWAGGMSRDTLMGPIYLHRQWHTKGKSGDRLTKAYDVTVQRHLNSHTKFEDSKYISCGVWVQILCEISKVPFEFSHKILNSYTAKIYILWGVKSFPTYDIL